MRRRGLLAVWFPELPPGLWSLELGAASQALGQGMVVPFVIIYLHNVRHFSLPLSGLVIAVFSGVSFLGTLLGGDLADRLGPRLPLRLALSLFAAGYAAFAFAARPWQAFLTIALAGLGNGLYWPPLSTSFANLSGEEHRTEAYALQRALTNLSFGIGGAAAGLITSTSHPRTFTLLFLIDAAMAVLALLLTTSVEVPPAQAATASTVAEIGGEAPPATPPDDGPSRWRDIWAQRLIVKLILLNVVFTMTGYVLLETVLPAFAKNHVAVSEHAIGFVFLANTFTILLVQMPLIKWLAGRKRLLLLAVMTVLWALLWLGAVAVGYWLRAGAAAAALIVVGALFAVGECALPVLNSLIADLAPPRLRGRSLGLGPASTAVGFMLGQAGFGLLMSRSYSAVWLVGVALLALTCLALVALERQVPEQYKRIPSRKELVPALAEPEAPPLAHGVE